MDETELRDALYAHSRAFEQLREASIAYTRALDALRELDPDGSLTARLDWGD